MSFRIALFAAAMAFATIAHAQQPKTTEGQQGSTMGLPDEGLAGASNGVGTDGSLDHNNGTASSTVAGMKNKVGDMGGAAGKTPASEKTESEPNLGGSKPSQH